MDDAWDVLLLALPQDWRELAQDTGASKGLRKDKTLDNLLRPILLRLGCGCSLRQTAHVVGPLADLPRLCDVTLLKRERKSKDWLHALCVRLFEELRLAVLPEGEPQVWTVDAATVKERRRRGSQWCVHYSVSLPSLACELLMLPKTEGPDMGKSSARFPLRADDLVLAGRGYSTAWGIRQVAAAGGRLSPSAAPSAATGGCARTSRRRSSARQRSPGWCAACRRRRRGGRYPACRGSASGCPRGPRVWRWR